jgi:hypothetical protein
MKAQGTSPWKSDRETALLVWMAACVSLFSFMFYFRHGDVLLYGDAVAHINIARRVFDSRTPGLLQLGTVWLPLPHLLMVPFLFLDRMWISGVGGSIPSMGAYVFGVLGIFRLVRGALSGDGEPDGAARAASWGAAIVYGANPNLMYMQATAMTEALYLAFFIWAVVFFSEFARRTAMEEIRDKPGGGRIEKRRRPSAAKKDEDRLSARAKALMKCGCCLAAACLTRYDGWFLAAAIGVAAVVLLLRNFEDRRLRPAVLKFALICAVAPTLWFGYNGVVYGNPLEFENGPYSAKAIEQKTTSTHSPSHPGAGNLRVAGLYFLKSAELNVAEHGWQQILWLALLVSGGVAASFAGRWPLLLLAAPLPFYALSVAYGGVPIFVPVWWPFSHYNLRYGLQLLPAFAAFGALAALSLVQEVNDRVRRRWPQSSRKVMAAVAAAVAALLVASYAAIWRAGPACYREAAVNMRGRNLLEKDVAAWLEHLPPNATLLMYLGDHVGALQQAGIPLRRVINEGNHRMWKQADPEGEWERALADPTKFADYVVAFEGDVVYKAMQGRHLTELVEIETTGQAKAILYVGGARQ